MALTTHPDKTPVVAVVDTGVDDALALVVAVRHPALDLRGVVCTGGNVPLDRVWHNTRYVLRLLESALPLTAGAERRLDGSPYPVRDVHGPDGLAGLAPARQGAGPPAQSAPTAQLAPSPAVRGAVVVSLGPLTAVVSLRSEWVVASYARPGEANHAMDPAAAGRVDVEHADVPAHPVPDADTVVALARSPSPVARLVAGLLGHQMARGAGLGDATVMLRLAEPELPPAEWARRLVSLAQA